MKLDPIEFADDFASNLFFGGAVVDDEEIDLLFCRSIARVSVQAVEVAFALCLVLFAGGDTSL